MYIMLSMNPISPKLSSYLILQLTIYPLRNWRYWDIDCFNNYTSGFHKSSPMYQTFLKDSYFQVIFIFNHLILKSFCLII